MRNERPPYYKVRRGRAFWEPGKERAARAGMKSSCPLGVDGDDAKALAWSLYYELRQKTGRGHNSSKEKAANYPKGSLGSFFEKYKTTRAWTKKSPTTRAEWEYCWRTHIELKFANTRINSITPAEFADWQDSIEAALGASARWRAVKIAKALFNAAVDNHVIARSPANSLPNPAPKGRWQIWRALEIAKLADSAMKIGKPAMSIAIRIAWETALSPKDVRTLTLSMLKRDASGAWFENDRSKTGIHFVCAISDELDGAIRGYVDGLGVVIPPTEPFLRTSRDAHQYTKARFIMDFALTRKAAFGNAENRRFQDIRRSANVEADLAGATPEERAEMLANSLDKDRNLEQTYTPRTVEKSRQMAAKRLEGRRILAGHSVNIVGESRK